CGNDACTMGGLGCEHKCELDPDGQPSCSCHENYLLNADAKTCIKMEDKKCPEMTCKNMKECYQLEQHCDGKQNCVDGSDEEDCIHRLDPHATENTGEHDPCKDFCKN